MKERRSGQGNLTMYKDPIVAEVRQAGQALAEQAEGDLHTFFQFLREGQQQYRDRLVQGSLRPPREIKFGQCHDQAND